MGEAVWLKEILNGLLFASSVTLVGLGLFVIFGLMQVINLAHGELLMLGAYVAYGLSRVGVSFWWSLILAPLATFILGILLEIAVIRRLHGRGDLSTLLATWGISIILQQAVRIAAGPQPKSVAPPIPGAAHVFGVTYPAYHLALIAISVLIVLGILMLYLHTPYGLMTRAAIGNSSMASAMGVNTRRLFTVSFGLGSAMAGLAGSLLSPLVGALPTMGVDFLARSFFVVIMGGMTDLRGVLVSGLIVGATESGFTLLTNATVANIVVLVVVVLVMLVRPRGLFGGR